MLTRTQAQAYQKQAAEMLDAADIIITPEERANIEVADFGLGEFERTGLLIITYVNTDRYCAKELIMLPGMTCPEHRHPSIGDQLGKRETFRCRTGEVYLYVEGEPTQELRAKVPAGSTTCYTVFHEVVLMPGEQYTIPPNTLHWFQAGPKGAIVSEFSSTSRDEADFFTDSRIRRMPEIADA